MSARDRSRLPLAPRAAPVCTDGHCVTCADEGIPMRVVSPGRGGIARCADGAGSASDVMTALVGDVVEGDVLLVHAGTALVRLTGEVTS